MPEHGRNIQLMIQHCVNIEDREERQKCAEYIAHVMSVLDNVNLDNEEARQRTWNHLAAISNYELDIDYPCEITPLPQAGEARGRVEYPAKKINTRHYGAIVEEYAQVICGMEDEDARRELSHLIANHMKRDLSNWNVEAMSDAKVTNDLAAYTDGLIRLDEEGFGFISDGELLSSLIPTSIKRKRRR